MSWRVPLRLARRELWRRPGRTLLVALLVALPVTALVLLDVQYRSSPAETFSLDRQFGSADAMLWLDRQFCEGACTHEEVAAALPDGATVVWELQAFLPLRTSMNGPREFATVSSVDMNQGTTEGLSELRSGRWPSAASEVAMTQDLIDALGIDVNTTFTLAHQSRDFRVVGVIDDGRDLVAPGFDFSVVRSVMNDIGYVDLPDGYSGPPTLAADSNLSLSMRWTEPTAVTHEEQQAVNASLMLGWLGGVLAMSVLGVVVAAAFAISGRRQLVAIGQLSANGADQRMLTRTLSLQGTVTGAFGVVLGLLAALVIHLRWPFALFGRPGGPTRVFAVDIVVIAATAVAVASVAALAPTRSLARMSVLSALAGRRPVGAVPAALVRQGAALLVGGVLVAVAAIRAGTNGGGTESGLLVAAGMIAAVLGVCALSPLLIDRLAGFAARGGAALRLAARGVGRHRPRAAAVFASLLIVGMATTGAGAIAEHKIRQDEAEDDWSNFRGDVVKIDSSRTVFADNQSGMTSVPTAVDDFQALSTRMDDVIAGSLQWLPAAVAYDSTATDPEVPSHKYLVVDDVLLELFGLPPGVRRQVLDSDVGVVLTTESLAIASEMDGFTQLSVPEVRVSSGPFISLPAAEALGLTVVPKARLYAIADHELTTDEALAAQRLGDMGSDLYYYSDEGGLSVHTEVQPNWFPDPTRTLSPAETRWIIIGSSFLLVILLVAFGMALWAVEGRDERDVLVAVGASPSSMARVAAWRAGGLTLGAMVLAVPVGLGIAWTIAHAARSEVVVPWLLAGALLLAVPLVIGAGAWACSAIAQRVRPVRMSSLTAD